MGLKYLDGKHWSEITREERYFCMQLYQSVVQTGVKRFVETVNRLTGIELDPDENWELGYEVCFFRDYRHHLNRKVPLESAKRTFDLCLMSDKTIVIIEAKCAERFKPDQLADFGEDHNRFMRLATLCPDLHGVKIVILGLVASTYRDELENQGADLIYRSFKANTRFMTWEDLADVYGNPELLRAGAVFNSSPLSFDKWNTGGYFTGPGLVKALLSGDNFWVGRRGAFEGFKSDVENGSWKDKGKKYQTNRQKESPGKNWFMLSELTSIMPQLHL